MSATAEGAGSTELSERLALRDKGSLLGALCFGGLIWLAAIHWGALLRPRATGDFVVLAFVGAGLGVMTTAGERLRGLTASSRAAIDLLGFIGVALAAGLAPRYLWPGTWTGELPDGIADGVAVLFTEQVPLTAGREPSAEMLLLLMFGILVSAGTRLLLRRSLVVAALVAVAIDAVAMAQIPPRGALVVGIAIALLLFGALAAQFGSRSTIGGTVLLTIAMAVSVAVASIVAGTVDRGRPLLDVTDVVSSVTGRAKMLDFSWGQSYDPQQWSRTGERVARVRIRGRTPYLKAAILDTFDGRAWQVTSGGARPERVGFGAGSPRKMEVRIDALRSRAFLGAGSTVGIENSTAVIEQSGLSAFMTRGKELKSGDRYDALVRVPTISMRQRRRAGADFDRRSSNETMIVMPDPDFGRGATARVYFPQWGSGLPISVQHADGSQDADPEDFLQRSAYRRSWNLAQQLATSSDSPATFTENVLKRVRDGANYTETPRSLRDVEAPLESFLFETKEGYCQHYSGAMALILRMGGVPARVASGFLPGTEEDGVNIIRDYDAHAWVETYVPGTGWVTDDPTPPIATGQTALGGDPETDVAAEGDTSGLIDRTGEGQQDSQQEPEQQQETTAEQQQETATARDSGMTVWLVGAAIAIGAMAILLVAASILVLLQRRRAEVPALEELRQALERTGRGHDRSPTLTVVETLVADDDAARSYVQALRNMRYAPSEEQTEMTAKGRRALRRTLARGSGWRGQLGALLAIPPLMGVPTTAAKRRASGSSGRRSRPAG